MDKGKMIQIRLQQEDIDRLDSLITHLQSNSLVRALGSKVSRITVTRLVIERGLKELEKEYDQKSV